MQETQNAQGPLQDAVLHADWGLRSSFTQPAYACTPTPTHQQDSFKPPCSNIALGDDRISPFHTSYTADFHAPFAAHSQLRSPMRNKDLAATQTSLVEHYASSYNRVGE